MVDHKAVENELQNIRDRVLELNMTYRDEIKKWNKENKETEERLKREGWRELVAGERCKDDEEKIRERVGEAYIDQKWGYVIKGATKTFVRKKDKSKFDDMPKEEYLGRKIISVKEEGHKKEEKVVHPSHYQLGELGIEAMDVIKAILTPQELKGFFKGNVIKYNLRAEKKNGLEDHKKARYYLDELIKEEDNGVDLSEMQK